MTKPAFLNNSFTMNSETHNSYGERIFTGLAYLIISIFGTTGNSLVIIAILLSRKLQTPTNIFVASLATADLLTCLFLIWNVIALLGRDGWPLPHAEWLCAVAGFAIFTCTGVSVYTLATIALNRFVFITKSLQTYQKIFSPIKIRLMIVFTCYTFVFTHIKRHFKKKRENELNNIALAEGSSIDQSTQRRADGISQMELNITKNLFLVVVAFFVCFSPYCVLQFIPGTYYLSLYGAILVVANSAMNPVIYARRHPHFKIVLTALIKCQYDKIPEPTDFLKRFLARRVDPFP
ncbi:adrenocorticotropic hormone receptor-like [Amphiura filiformis]|uniref:adrenocorticotropic hormone receptor-like n=1 Tax=Amphiura filiformis TaxID=82378 RepID=UPI003B21C7EE